jgi:hypothetical protein
VSEVVAVFIFSDETPGFSGYVMNTFVCQFGGNSSFDSGEQLHYPEQNHILSVCCTM